MQTFLPYANFAQSSACLDSKRLIKQRLETYQLLRAIYGETRGWVNHPATKMWKPTPDALCLYGEAISNECEKRGYFSDLGIRIQQYRKEPDSTLIVMPKWLGLKKFHDSHQSNLLRKEPAYYRYFNWTVPINLEYFWPNPEWL